MPHPKRGISPGGICFSLPGAVASQCAPAYAANARDRKPASPARACARGRGSRDFCRGLLDPLARLTAGCEISLAPFHATALFGYAGGMMKLMLLGLALSALGWSASNTYEFTLNSIDGTAMPMASFKGKVVLLVNVASRCGYTPQYTALEKLYETYKDKGLVIVGIPANNFGGQEPGSNEEIKTFCTRTYNVTFPMMSKVSVKGADTTPLYQFLTDKSAHPETGGEIKWNFTKFLIDRNGKVIQRFEPAVKPESPEVAAAIEAALSR
jgi:glutathione peroxidase